MFLLLSSALLLVPKIALLDFSADVLSVRLSPIEVLAVLLQDAALVALWWAVLTWVLRRPAVWRWALGFCTTGALLLVLLLDCRARELWLKPLDVDIVGYALGSLDDLASGSDVFFRHDAGLGMTLRRMIVLTGAAHVLLWGAVGLLLWRGRGRGGGVVEPRRRARLAARGAVAVAPFAFALGLLGISAMLAPAMYGMEQNVIVKPVVSLMTMQNVGTTVAAHELAQQFEQPARSAHELFTTPRRIAVDAAPFKNLVLVMFETWRWKGMHLDEAADTPAPYLRKLAHEGILARSYVSMPHSSKSYYSVMTGRHPWPGIEMVESIQPRNESLFWALAERPDGGVATHCFSTMCLTFENLGSLLRSLGVSSNKQFGEERVNSFGHCDEQLLATVPELAAGNGPFAAIYLPLAAHYPYDYPGKPPEADWLDSYHACVSNTDAFLSRLTASLGAAGLLQDTLLVIVGDHGESFGEHGTMIHNNSMYEEEVTTPLIFWSADGRLRTPGVLEASHIDITPTVLDLMGLHDCEMNVQGRSLLRGDAPRVAYALSFFDGAAQARIEGGGKVIHYPTTGHMLAFDLALDPEERSPMEVEEPTRGLLQRQFEAHTAYQRSLFGR